MTTEPVRPSGAYAPLYEAARNSDQTEGRGPMRGFDWFDNISDAVAAVQGEGVMGSGPGEVYALEVLTDLAEIRANGGPIRRTWVYGPKWLPGEGRKVMYAPGWDPRGRDPEWAEYQRLRAKFESDVPPNGDEGAQS